MMSRVHAIARWTIAVSLVVTSIAGYASNQLLDEDCFTELVSSSIESAEVRELLATKAVDVALDASMPMRPSQTHSQTNTHSLPRPR